MGLRNFTALMTQQTATSFLLIFDALYEYFMKTRPSYLVWCCSCETLRSRDSNLEFRVERFRRGFGSVRGVDQVKSPEKVCWEGGGLWGVGRVGVVLRSVTVERTNQISSHSAHGGREWQ